MKASKKVQIFSNLLFLGGIVVLFWIDWRIVAAIFILVIAKIAEEKAREMEEDGK